LLALIDERPDLTLDEVKYKASGNARRPICLSSCSRLEQTSCSGSGITIAHDASRKASTVGYSFRTATSCSIVKVSRGLPKLKCNITEASYATSNTRWPTAAWALYAAVPRSPGHWTRPRRSSPNCRKRPLAIAYALTDRAAWANFKNRQNLEILTEGDPALFNLYGSILVNPAKWPEVKFSEAKIWEQWLTSRAGLDAITSYRIDGEELFFPPRPRL
jgi:hypothetical protein